MIGEANSRYECNRRNTFLFAKCSSSRPNAFCTGINDSAIAIREIKVRKSHAGRLRGEVPHDRRVRQILPPGQSVADRAITASAQHIDRTKSSLRNCVGFIVLRCLGVSLRRELAGVPFPTRSMCPPHLSERPFLAAVLYTAAR